MNAPLDISLKSVLPGKQEYARLFDSTGWDPEHRLDPDRLYDAISHSWYLLSAYRDNELVGFGRVISDGVQHALIVDLIVRPDHQSEGIGSRILTDLVGRCRASGIGDIQLFCAKGKAGFYEKHGFVARPADAPGMEMRSVHSELPR